MVNSELSIKRKSKLISLTAMDSIRLSRMESIWDSNSFRMFFSFPVSNQKGSHNQDIHKRSRCRITNSLKK
jgi:hypothetical protein